MGVMTKRTLSVGPADDITNVREHRALAWTAAASVAVIFWLVRPIGLGILLGTIIALVAQPAFDRLTRWVGARWAALVITLGSGIAIAATLGGIGWMLVSRGTVLSADLVAAVGQHGSGDDVFTRVGRYTDSLGVSPDDLRDHVQGLAGQIATGAAQGAAVIVSTVGDALLGLLFMLLAMHFVLRNRKVISRRLQDTLPLRPTYTVGLLAEFRRVGRATLLGNVTTNVVQGVFTAIGFWITGVPDPIFFGVLTAVLSFVPAVGVLLVLVPACIGLAATGHAIAAVIEAVWALVFVIGVSDYVIKPLLVRGEAKVPSLVTFAALFGGVELFGLQGLLIGPVLMALAIAVLRLYAVEARALRHLEPGAVERC
jgi:predicted PurR-regulated permease PerM